MYPRWYTLKNDMAKLKKVLQQEKYFWIITKQCIYQKYNNMNRVDYNFFYLKIKFKMAAKLFSLPCRFYKTLFNQQSTMLHGTRRDG